MIRHLVFFISEAVIGMKRSFLMIAIAVSTITVSLMIFGLFLIVNINLNHVADFMSSRLEVRVFLNPELTRDQIKSFKLTVSQIEGVKTVQFIDKTAAWHTFSKSYEHLNLKKMLKNPLPHSLKVILSDNQYIFEKTKVIEQYTSYVTDVKNGGIIAERMHSLTKWVRYSGVLLVVFLTMATLFIIINTIRLTVMKLVGATNSFIRGPFLIEGLFIGLIGGGCSLFFLKNIYFIIGQKLQEGVPFIPIIFDPYIINQIYVFLVLIGGCLGVFGAYISVSRLLKSTV
jgi:cell division transport system permease protein